MVPATASRTASQSPIRRQTTIPVSTTVFTALDKAKLTLPNRWPSLPLPRLRRRLPAVTVKMAKRSNGDEVDEDKKKKTLIRSFFFVGDDEDRESEIRAVKRPISRSAVGYPYTTETMPYTYIHVCIYKSRQASFLLQIESFRKSRHVLSLYLLTEF